MQYIDGRWIVSPQDIIAEFECDHRVALDVVRVTGLMTLTPTHDEMLDLLVQQGLKNEQQRLTRLPVDQVRLIEAPGRSIPDYESAWQSTRDAMLEEAPFIYQGVLFTGDFLGYVDFLVLARDEKGVVIRNAEGRAMYEPVDAKSARSAKATAALQVGAYAEALHRLGWPMPTRVHLWLGVDGSWQGDARRFAAVATEVRQRLLARLAGASTIPVPDWAPPRPACGHCRWADHCEAGRRGADDPSLIQGIRSATRQRLVDAGLTTVPDVAGAGDDRRPARVSEDTFARLRAQAQIQLRGRQSGRIEFEVVDPDVLASLPPRDPGDIWFDMEGFPQWLDGRSLEYMFGFGWMAGGTFEFEAYTAHDRVEERDAFVRFIQEILTRRRQHPGMHVYHYADYERRALLELAQRHGVCEDEVDRLVREGCFVDLYKVVRGGLRFSTESLSLKYIEPVYDVRRSAEDAAVTNALGSVIAYDRVMSLRESGDTDTAARSMAEITEYNRVDCDSTRMLDDWLRARAEGRVHGGAVSGSADGDDGGAGNDGGEVDSDASVPAEARGDVAALLAGVPVDPASRSPEQQARALLAGSLDFHAREERPQWWQVFEWASADLEGLRDAPAVFVADDASASEWGKTGRQRKQRREITLRSATQEPRDVFDGTSEVHLLYEEAPPGSIQPSDSSRGLRRANLDEVSDALRITEMEGADGATWSETPIAVLPGPPISTGAVREALMGLAVGVTGRIEEGADPFPPSAWCDLLLGSPPRRSTPLPRSGNDIDDIVNALKTADSYVAVQGPPGTGKTYVGSRAVAELARQGWRIGVVAQSHAVVDNFLAALHDADPAVAIGKEAQGGKGHSRPWHVATLNDFIAGQGGGYVLGGTTWTFCRPAIRELGLDLLVIDEAGQFSLANAIAAGHTMRTMLLLGDPQQLPQVSQALHPEPVNLSVLEHVSAGQHVIPSDRGYFLDASYRMHPALTRPVSRLQYDGQLHSAPVTSLRHLDGTPPGIVPVEVDHVNNTTSSVEEADKVVGLVSELLGSSWTDASDGSALPVRPMDEGDIIIVAAYNAQVRLIRRRLAEANYTGIPVGTVDKFQGREAAVVIVSMATSSGDDLPRGIDFLLSPNRLNVAISRGQWACLLVHSPHLRHVAPTTTEGVSALGAFLGILGSD